MKIENCVCVKEVRREIVRGKGVAPPVRDGCLRDWIEVLCIYTRSYFVVYVNKIIVVKSDCGGIDLMCSEDIR